MRKVKETWHCDFCEKSNDEVDVMIAGPNGHAICGSCAEIAMEIVIQKKKDLEDDK